MLTRPMAITAKQTNVYIDIVIQSTNTYDINSIPGTYYMYIYTPATTIIIKQ